MRTALLVAIVVLISIFQPTGARLHAQDWTGVASILEGAVVPLRIAMNLPGRPFPTYTSCSGWIINSEFGYVVTAEHCVPDPELLTSVTVLGLRTVLVNSNSDPDVDIAVYRVDGLEGDALKLRGSLTKRGTPIAMLGFPTQPRLLDAVFRGGWVADPDAMIKTRDGTEGAVLIDLIGQAGGSGSPVVDEDGRVVTMFTRYLLDDGRQATSAGPTGIKLREFLEPFLPYE